MPTINEDAKTRLEKAGLSVSEVIRVHAEEYPEAVLYRSDAGKAMTAWAVVKSDTKGQSVTYISEPGFIAERSTG